MAINTSARAKIFNPKLVSGLGIWFTSRERGSLLNAAATPATPGGTIATWNSQVNSYVFTATGTQKPLLTEGINGRFTGAKGDGSDDKMDIDSAGLSFLNNQSGVTALFVVQWNSFGSGNKSIFNFYPATGSGQVNFGQNAGNPLVSGRVVYATDTQSIVTDTAIPLSTGRLYCMVYQFDPVNRVVRSIRNGKSGGWSATQTGLTAGNFPNVNGAHVYMYSDSPGACTFIEGAIWPRILTDGEIQYLTRSACFDYGVTVQ